MGNVKRTHPTATTDTIATPHSRCRFVAEGALSKTPPLSFPVGAEQHCALSPVIRASSTLRVFGRMRSWAWGLSITGSVWMGADEHRQALGFMSVAATDALGSQGVRVLDPASTLISATVVLASGTVVYPSVIIDADERSRIEFGERCVLYPGCLFEARDGARIVIGADSELGPGGVRIWVRGAEESVVMSEEARLMDGCELTGVCELGRGAQILGAISARSVRLGGGRGGHRWPKVKERGAVLKGVGIADGVRLEQGEVKSCRASFGDARVERQSAYHPDARREAP